jgi:putative transposase
MVVDTGKDIISRSMQLAAGRVGQEYNQKKNRKGAFWEDGYHATIVQTNKHLMSCMVYIDLNMLRAGAVNHPSEWDVCGYNEILNEPARYKIIDREALKNLLGFTDEDALRDAYSRAISPQASQVRQPMWTESIAVGDEDYVNKAKRELSSMALGRKVIPESSAYVLREPSFPYKAHFDAKNDALRFGNTYLWDIYHEESTC